MRPETRYTQSTGEVNIAYQVLGDQERDLVLVPGWIFHLEVVWEHPAFERVMRRLTENFRIILFDKRGTGLSDRAPGASTLEERMDDVRAVMDAAGSERAAVMGWSEGGNIASLFAATYPERCEALIVYGAGARYAQAPDYPLGWNAEQFEQLAAIFTSVWGQGTGAYLAAGGLAHDEEFRRWFGRYERLTVSPGEGLAMLRVNMEVDTTGVLGHIRTPTLVLHNEGDALVPVDHGRYIAERIPGARLKVMSGSAHLFWFSNPDEVAAEIETFVLGHSGDAESERVLSTVLFTDLVGSTERAADLGDTSWRRLLDIHDEIARERLDEFRGRLVKTTGDGVLATFDGPARALRCACRLRGDVAKLDLDMRAGVHTGEIEVRGDDVGGMGVHIAARVLSAAGPGEVLASRTVKDLVAGAGVEFEDRGTHDLKGLPEKWELYAVRA